MAQQVQDLINKIKSEGVDAAQKQAQDIIGDAQNKAKAIIAEAQAKADQIINQAKDESRKTKESTRIALQQAARDMLLALRKEIEYMLNRIVKNNADKVLSSEELAGLLQAAIKGFLANNGAADIRVTLDEASLARLKDGFLAQLKDQVKKPITLQTAKAGGKGFTVSFDGGKSAFDFTSESMAGYLSNFLNEEISQLLKTA